MRTGVVAVNLAALLLGCVVVACSPNHRAPAPPPSPSVPMAMPTSLPSGLGGGRASRAPAPRERDAGAPCFLGRVRFEVAPGTSGPAGDGCNEGTCTNGRFVQTIVDCALEATFAFPVGSSRITTETEAHLGEAARELVTSWFATEFDVIGYADLGEGRNPRALAATRSRIVQDALVSRGVPVTHLRVTSHVPRPRGDSSDRPATMIRSR